MWIMCTPHRHYHSKHVDSKGTTIHFRYLIRYAFGERVCVCVLMNFRFLWFLFSVYSTLTIESVSCKTADEHTLYKKNSFPIFFFFSSLCSCCFQQILFYIHIYLDGSKFLVYLENARLLFACLKRWKCFLCFFFVFFAPLHLISCILFFWSASRIFDKMDYNRDRFELSETQRKWRERKKAERKVSKQSTGTFQQCIRTEAPEINVWEVMTIENDEVSRKV